MRAETGRASSSVLCSRVEQREAGLGDQLAALGEHGAGRVVFGLRLHGGGRFVLLGASRFFVELERDRQLRPQPGENAAGDFERRDLLLQRFLQL